MLGCVKRISCSHGLATLRVQLSLIGKPGKLDFETRDPFTFAAYV